MVYVGTLILQSLGGDSELAPKDVIGHDLIKQRRTNEPCEIRVKVLSDEAVVVTLALADIDAALATKSSNQLAILLNTVRQMMGEVAPSRAAQMVTEASKQWYTTKQSCVSQAKTRHSNLSLADEMRQSLTVPGKGKTPSNMRLSAHTRQKSNMAL